MNELNERMKEEVKKKMPKVVARQKVAESEFLKNAETKEKIKQVLKIIKNSRTN